MINFSEMTAAEKAEKTYNDLQKRKAAKKKAIETDARGYEINNMFRTKQRNHGKYRRAIRSV